MSTRKKIMISLIVLLLVLTGGAYGYGVWYFTGHFLPGSMVNGFNCSYMTVDESEALLSKKAGAGVLAIETRNNGQESITAQQVELSYASDGSIKKLMRDQDRFIWFLAFNQEQIYTVSSAIQYDEQEMQAAISGLKCMQTGQDPVDAHIDEQNDKLSSYRKKKAMHWTRKNFPGCHSGICYRADLPGSGSRRLL